MATTLGVRLAQELKRHGVDTVFGIPGVHNIELYRGLEQSGINHVLARHEQGAGFMADGYARATGKPGVAFVITGPGLTNIMTPMGQAYADSVPMLVISSCLPTDDPTPGRLHQMRDQEAAAGCVCEWSVQVDSAEAAFGAVEQAFAEFGVTRHRPKHISIPIDLLGSAVPEPSRIAPEVSAPVVDDVQIGALADALARAKMPLFILGGGAIAVTENLRNVLETTGSAAFETYAGRGVVGQDYPLSFGANLARPDSARVIAQADLVVVVGSELAEVDLWRSELGETGTIVRIDLDEAVLNDKYAADLKIHGDAGAVFEGLKSRVYKGNTGWNAETVAWTRDMFRAQVDADRPGIVPYVMAMQAALPDSALIYSDMTQLAYVAKEVFQSKQPGSWHHPYGFGTLGYALPAAIGGQIARGAEPVISISGDSGIQYNIQELGVAAELSLPVINILWDNGKLKEIEDAMVQAQIAPNAVVARNPDFEKLAAAYGIAYHAPRNPAEFEAVLRAALATNGPMIIHISAE